MPAPLLSSFLADAFARGEVVVPVATIETDAAATAGVLRDRVAELTPTLAGPPPPLNEPLALATAEWFAGFCKSFAHAAPVSKPPPSPQTAADHWSGDLVMSLLPDLRRIAAAARGGDAKLVAELDRVAADWPLACVGLVDSPVDPFWSDSALRMLFIDRATERGATPSDPRAIAMLAVASGAAAANPSST